jgi:ferredoxin
MGASQASSASKALAQLVRPDACMECGACQLNCPTEAVTVDSGVGCAAALIRAALLGEETASCGGGGECSSSTEE